jgi:transcriptional regulator with XRE-family HTH domain
MISKLLAKLKGSKKRRDLFVAGQIKTGIPFQVRALRDKKGWTQAQLGTELGMTQTNISRLESPGYGRLNITTLQRIASVFDVALIVRFVPFSELMRWTDRLSPEVMAPASFNEEIADIEKEIALQWPQGSYLWAPITVGTVSGRIDVDVATTYPRWASGTLSLEERDRTYQAILPRVKILSTGEYVAHFGSGALGLLRTPSLDAGIDADVIDYTQGAVTDPVTEITEARDLMLHPSVFARGGSTQQINDILDLSSDVVN